MKKLKEIWVKFYDEHYIDIENIVITFFSWIVRGAGAAIGAGLIIKVMF